MDFDDTPAEAAFRAEAQGWLEAHAPPKGGPEDFSSGYLDPAVDPATHAARCRAWQACLHEEGWAGITWPVEYGGRGGRPIEAVIFYQEQARFGVSTGPFAVAHGLVGPTLLAHGREEQRQRYLPPMLRGEEIWCQLFSEPDAGSDLAGLTTAAARDGDQWVVTGQKVWTSGAQHSQWGILLARTDPHVPKHRGITFFLVDMAAPGIEIRPLRQMTGESHFSEVFLDEVRVPAGAVVGEVGGGWRVAVTTLANERSLIGGSQSASPTALIAHARAAGVGRDPWVRQQLARAHTGGEILRYLGYRAQTALSHGRSPGPETSVVKAFYARHLKAMCDTALAVGGPWATIAPPDGDAAVWQQRFLSAPSIRIAGGSDEVQRTIMGERVLGLPVEPRPDREVAFRQPAEAGR